MSSILTSITAFSGVLLSLPYSSLSCSETITVYEASLSGPPPQDLPDLSQFEGDYYFWGFDSSTGYPRYVQPSTMAEFSIEFNSFNQQTDLGISYSLPSNAFTYQGNTFGPITWVGASSSSGEILEVDGFSTTTNFAISPGILNGDPVNNPFLFSFFFTNFFPIRLLASLDDCDSVGLSFAPDTSVCPFDYDDNLELYFGDCASNQENCNVCIDGNQCGTCAPGFYKMGWNHKCQSCTDNYKNCNSCSNWNGCTSCNSGFNLGWYQVCGDEVCR